MRLQTVPSIRRYVADVRRSRMTLYYLCVREFRVRYRYTHLGWLWAVIQPLAMMAALTAVFTIFTPVKTDEPYPVFSLLNLSVWTFFAASLSGSSQSLLSNGPLLKKVYFPRCIVPAAAVFGSAVDFGAMLLSVAAIFAVFRIHLHWTALLLVVAVVWEALFCLAMAVAVSMLTVFFRDLRHLIAVALQVWLFASPVLYPVTAVPERFRHAYMLNPMAGILSFYHDILLRGRIDRPRELAISAAVTVVLLACSAAYFMRRDKNCVDLL